ncbi:MAG: hypothetical protein ACR2GH_14980 [Pseudonocardia sp.]
MAVSLPTAADVRKAREQAAKTTAERAEVARTPLLAVLGVGDFAVTTVTEAVAKVRTRATAQAEDMQHRVAELPQRLSTDELRKAVADLRAQAADAYAGFAERGAKAWDRIRSQPQVETALSTIESYTEKFDARVDGLVNEAHDTTEKILSTVTRQTRSTGERVARATQRFAGEAAEAITEAGDEVAHETRSTTRKAANRTAPSTADHTSATRRTKTTQRDTTSS